MIHSTNNQNNLPANCVFAFLAQRRKLRKTISTFLWSLLCSRKTWSLKTVSTGGGWVSQWAICHIYSQKWSQYSTWCDLVYSKMSLFVNKLGLRYVTINAIIYHPIGIKYFIILFPHQCFPNAHSCVPCNCFQCESCWHDFDLLNVFLPKVSKSEFLQSALTASQNLSSIMPYYYIYTQLRIFV